MKLPPTWELDFLRGDFSCFGDILSAGELIFWAPQKGHGARTLFVDELWEAGGA